MTRSPSKSHPKRPAGDRSAFAILLTIVLASTFCLPLAADDVLQQGQWKGKYTPVNLGADIDATFCVQPDHNSTPPWKVVMILDLSPPGNEPAEFEFQEAEEDSLNFRINLVGVLRECLLKDKNEDGLYFECTFVDIESDSTESLRMRRVDPQPDGVCMPE